MTMIMIMTMSHHHNHHHNDHHHHHHHHDYKPLSSLRFNSTPQTTVLLRVKTALVVLPGDRINIIGTLGLDSLNISCKSTGGVDTYKMPK